MESPLIPQRTIEHRKLVHALNHFNIFYLFAAKYTNSVRGLRDIKPTSINLHAMSVAYEIQEIRDLIQFLNRHLKNDLVAAIIHGSVATQDTTPFSDMDALILLKNSVLNNKRRLLKVSYYLNQSQKYFYKFDPLQHHGWFVLFEKNLANFDEIYFPSEILKHSSCIFPPEGINLCICTRPASSFDFTIPFYQLSRAIYKKISLANQHNNIYLLKGFLSQFMLLPALYCQARDKKGISKKDSFNSARMDFADSEWSIMDEVSKLREQWCYHLNTLQHYLLTRPNFLLQHYRRYFAPKPVKLIREKFTPEFYARIGVLTDSMVKEIEKISTV